MAKINFTQEHLDKLIKSIATAVLNNVIVYGPVGQQYNVYELVNTLSIGSLRTISTALSKKKASLSVEDQWTDNPNQDKIAQLDSEIDLISLIIGYKLKQEEIAANAKERAALEEQLQKLKDSQKTPADLIAELEQKLSDLE